MNDCITLEKKIDDQKYQSDLQNNSIIMNTAYLKKKKK